MRGYKRKIYICANAGIIMRPRQGFLKDLNKLMKFPKEGIFSTVLAKSDKYDCTLMCLAKGAEIGTHTSARAGAVIVMKGKGVFTLLKKRMEMKPGTFIFMPRNAPHSLRAKEDLAILLLLIKE